MEFLFFAFVKTQSMPLVNLNKSFYIFRMDQRWYALKEIIIYIKIMNCEKRNVFWKGILNFWKGTLLQLSECVAAMHERAHPNFTSVWQGTSTHPTGCLFSCIHSIFIELFEFELVFRTFFAECIESIYTEYEHHHWHLRWF